MRGYDRHARHTRPIEGDGPDCIMIEWRCDGHDIFIV
jgi:hypothetical protein